MTNRMLSVGLSLALVLVVPARAADGAAPAAKPPVPAPAAATKPEPAADKGRPPPLEPTYLRLRIPLGEKVASVPVAQVEDEVITAEELSAAIAAAHSSRGPEGKAGKKDVTPILDRIIATRLVALEAREMGLDELPATKDAIEKFKQAQLRKFLQLKATEESKADPATVQKLVDDATREWKLLSLHFQKDEDAARVAQLMKEGKSFEDVAKALLTEGKAQGGEEPKYFSVKDLLPQVASSLAEMKPGEVSAPLKLARGVAVVKLLDVRTVENPKARVDAEQTALSEKRRADLGKYYDALVKKHVVIDWKLLEKVDYEAKKPGIEALSKDKRVLARFKQGKPITVADLTEALNRHFFHGLPEAASKRSVNSQRSRVLDSLISKRVVAIEATRLGFAETPQFKKELADFNVSLLFSTYLEKAVAPDVKVTEADLRAYYDEHKREYTYPAFYKLDGMAFSDVKKAQAALDKLRSGTDFKWLRANADGLAKPGEGALTFDGSTVTASSLPKDLVQTLAGTKRGDNRLYATSQGTAYVLTVLESVDSSVQPFEEVRATIQEKVAGDRLGKAVDEHVAKLRKARDVKVFITGLD